MITSLLTRIFDCKVIVNCDHDPYLFRWYLWRSERLGIFLHKFIRSDEDRALHDHPWNFIVIPIWRGYVEYSEFNHDRDGFEIRFPRRRRVWPIISTRVRCAEYRHRVELIRGRPSWSIFIRFHERRTWGFWPKSGFMAWNVWWKDKCE